MIRISIGFFHTLGGVLRNLTGLNSNMKLSQGWATLYRAQTELESLFSADWFYPAVRAAYNPGQRLLAAIKVLTEKTDFDENMDLLELAHVMRALDDFETVLVNELGNADAYFVTRKAGYDTSVLIHAAEKCFPVDLGVKVPKAIPDVREAGKCLAFELPTAAGIHALRANEAVLREYWTVVSGKKQHPGNRSMGAYLKKMDDLKIGDAKVKAALRQIKDLHRNPLMHPRDTLDLDEAVSIFGVCQSAIRAMLKAIPAPSPSAAVSVPSP